MIDDVPKSLGRSDRAHAFQELQNPKPGHLIPRILKKAQDVDEILDVRSFQEPQAPVFDKGNPASG